MPHFDCDENGRAANDKRDRECDDPELMDECLAEQKELFQEINVDITKIRR